MIRKITALSGGEEIKRDRMEKAIRAMGFLKWLGFPLGYIMYFFTKDSFGEVIGMILCVIAAAAFWLLMVSERSRIIGQTIVSEIRLAISETANVESFIEIKTLRSGVIARVYLINARDKAAMIHRSIARRMDGCDLKKYLWIMQLTDIPGINALRETRKMLNEQLIEELLRKDRENRM